jgi:hypothetical protein
MPADYKPIASAEEAHGHQAVKAEMPKLKNAGKLGEQLEGDVYLFKALSVKQCESSGPAPAKGPAPIVIGAEVELRAKQRLNISPRDVRLSSGGIVFHASVDPKREAKGCEPLIKHGSIGKDEVVKGWVIFDVPPPEPPNLLLTYMPTRWGGAGTVVTKLDGCVSCGAAKQ